MRKLKLQIDNLKVESFETSEAGAERRGTVAAHMPKPGGPVIIQTEVTGPCCDITLALSCVQTNCIDECWMLETVEPCA